MWNEDEVKGKGKQIKGTIKDKAGKVTGNRDLEAEGKADRDEGRLQEGYGKARRKVGEVVEDVGKAIRK